METTSDETPKKCFCARCFMHIGADDKVDVEGQNFHKLCAMCCICRKIPTSLKMFYGHVFCSECFKSHVMANFKGGAQRNATQTHWWMQWPKNGSENYSETKKEEEEEKKTQHKSESASTKKCFCTRCLQPIEGKDRIVCGPQCFHPHCARCCCCQQIPTSSIKVYYGQVFCDECFQKNVMSEKRDEPADFMKTCFDQWQNNAQFSDCIKEFMSSGKNNTPLVFMMPSEGTEKCKTSAKASVLPDDDWDLPSEFLHENTTPGDNCEPCEPVSINKDLTTTNAAEKIEKLTKYLHKSKSQSKKWQNICEIQSSNLMEMNDQSSNVHTRLTQRSDVSMYGWIDLQETLNSTSAKSVQRLPDCPKCLWHSGSFYVNSEYMRKVMCCGDKSMN